MNFFSSAADSLARFTTSRYDLHIATANASHPGDLVTPRIRWADCIPIALVHLVPFLAFLTGVPWWNWVLMGALYVVRMFFITAGYHRYFAHRSFRTSRVMQFIFAFGGGTAVQKGPLWWAGNHRMHHRYADTDRDAHSPIKGFWWSHIGWIISDAHTSVPANSIDDFEKFPELRFLNKHDWIPPWSLAIACALIGGWSALLIGFFLSTVLLWHGTFLVNSVAHVIGTRRYVTTDTSRNNVVVALFTGGEGWHNNHHHLPNSARQGFFWWEVDTTYYVLRAMAAVRLVSDLKTPTAEQLRNSRVRDGNLDVGMLKEYVRLAGTVVATSRVADVDLADTQLDEAKTALETALAEATSAGADVNKLDRQRRRNTSSKSSATH